jgi:hypothetical protein
MTNEVLCKFLAHNLCVLIQEQCELGIETVFWKETPAAPLQLAAPVRNEMSQPETEYVI